MDQHRPKVLSYIERIHQIKSLRSLHSLWKEIIDDKKLYPEEFLFIKEDFDKRALDIWYIKAHRKYYAFYERRITYRELPDLIDDICPLQGIDVEAWCIYIIAYSKCNSHRSVAAKLLSDYFPGKYEEIPGKNPVISQGTGFVLKPYTYYNVHINGKTLNRDGELISFRNVVCYRDYDLSPKRFCFDEFGNPE